MRSCIRSCIRSAGLPVRLGVKWRGSKDKGLVRQGGKPQITEPLRPFCSMQMLQCSFDLQTRSVHCVPSTLDVLNLCTKFTHPDSLVRW